jgi:hypothetical protein
MPEPKLVTETKKIILEGCQKSSGTYVSVNRENLETACGTKSDGVIAKAVASKKGTTSKDLLKFKRLELIGLLTAGS